MRHTEDEFDRLFHSLADPTRRAILGLLAGANELSVTALAQAIGRPMADVSHHLGVLRDAGLVTWRKGGRERLYRFAEGVTRARSGAGWSLRRSPYTVTMDARAEGGAT